MAKEDDANDTMPMKRVKQWFLGYNYSLLKYSNNNS